MVSASHERELQAYRRAEERAEIVRAIARNISAMDDISISTREVIAESKALIRRLDRSIRRK
jgi:hypothetical protein